MPRADQRVGLGEKPECEEGVWTFSAGNYTRALNDYYLADDPSEARQSVIAHELGHSVGLAHEYGAVLMNPWTWGDSSRYGEYGVNTPQQDDVDGVNAIYP